MKKVLAILLSLAMVMCLFVGCNNSPEYTSSVYYEQVGGNTTDDAQDNQSGEDGTADGDADAATDGDTSGSTSGSKTSGSTSGSKTSGSTSGSNTSGGSTSGNKTSGGSTTSGGNTSGGSTSGGSTSGSSTIPSYLNGKTITMAVTEEPQYATSSFKAMISAFQKKYNCKIQTSKLVFDNFNQMVSQRMSTGKPYDICYIHGSFFVPDQFPQIYADLTSALKEVGDSNFDAEKTSMFDWGGKKYAVCNNTSSVDPWLMYYNKLLFEENGLEDPLTLYKSGKWTWDKIFEMGKKVTNAKEGIYFLGSHIITPQIYGTSVQEVKNGKVYLHLTNPNVRKGLELIRKIYIGNEAIGLPNNTDNGGDDYKNFVNGTVFIEYREANKYSELCSRAKTSMAFGKKASNLEIVPVPIAAENTQKAYPTAWFLAIAAGAGSDARIAVTWADFIATYKSSVKGSNEMSTAQQALVNSLRKGKVAPTRHGTFSTSSAKTTVLYDNLVTDAISVKGTDITKAVNEVYPTYVACIEETVGKGNFIVN